MFRYEIFIPVSSEILCDKKWDFMAYAIIADHLRQTSNLSTRFLHEGDYAADKKDKESIDKACWVIPSKEATHLIISTLGKDKKTASALIKAGLKNGAFTHRTAADGSIINRLEIAIPKKMSCQFVKVGPHTLNLFLLDEELDSFDFKIYLKLKSWYGYSTSILHKPYEFRIGGTSKNTLLENIGYCSTSSSYRAKASESLKKLIDRGLIAYDTGVCTTWTNNIKYKMNFLRYVGEYSEEKEIEGEKTWCLLSKSQMRTLERSEE